MAVRDHAVRKVVRRKRDRNSVAKDHADAILAHAPAELCADNRASIGLHLELAARKHLRDETVELYMIIASQNCLLRQHSEIGTHSIGSGGA
jgi:hypothetical protein